MIITFGMGFADSFRMAIDHLSTEPFREITVTDVEFLFDFGLKDSITIYDGDAFDHNPALGTIEVILAPKALGRFPEYISYQVSKIIVMRKCQRIVRVKITPPLSDPVVAASASVPAPVDPESSNPSDSTTLAAIPPPGHPAVTSPGSPARRRRTPTPRPPRTPRTVTVPPVAPLAATVGQTPDSDSDGDHDEKP